MELRLKEILKEKRLTLNGLSEKTGISASNLSNYCSGNISPTLETLQKIANALNVDVTELFKEKNPIKFFIEYNGEKYRLTNNDFINIIKNKVENGYQ